MALTQRRPCVIDTSQPFCPQVGCDCRGWLGLGNLRANGHPSGGVWRQFYCRSCNGYFLESHGTIFHGKRLSVELIGRVLACLAEGLGIRATARVFEVDGHTVLQWLVEAAEQLQAFSAYYLCDVHVTLLQLDELYAVLRGVRDGGSRTRGLRIMFRDLSRPVCEGSISRSSALETGFQTLVQPYWPASEHTSAVQRHDPQLVPLLRPSAAGATVAPERATLLAASTRDR